MHSNAQPQCLNDKGKTLSWHGSRNLDDKNQVRVIVNWHAAAIIIYIYIITLAGALIG